MSNLLKWITSVLCQNLCQKNESCEIYAKKCSHIRLELENFGFTIESCGIRVKRFYFAMVCILLTVLRLLWNTLQNIWVTIVNTLFLFFLHNCTLNMILLKKNLDKFCEAHVNVTFANLHFICLALAIWITSRYRRSKVCLVILSFFKARPIMYSDPGLLAIYIVLVHQRWKFHWSITSESAIVV